MSVTLRDVCKIGQGADCCRYLLLDSGGFFCGKTNPSTKKLVDNNWDSTKTAQGDNCPGKQPSELNG